mgnify:CR=1 FL=1
MNNTKDTALIKLISAKNLLAQCTTIQRAKEIMDIAAAAEVYAKRAKLSSETVQQAIEVKVTAQRMLGKMLKKTEKAKGARGQLNGKTCSGGIKLKPPENSTCPYH